MKNNFSDYYHRFGVLKIAITLSLMLLCTAPLFAHGGTGEKHCQNDSIVPSDSLPSHTRDSTHRHINDSIPPPLHVNDSVPSHTGDSTHQHINDSILPSPQWNDSVPSHTGDSTHQHINDSIPPPPHVNDSLPSHTGDSTHQHINDSIPPPHVNDSVPSHTGDSTHQHINDSIPPPPHVNDSVPSHTGDSTHQHINDSIPPSPHWNDSVPLPPNGNDSLPHYGDSLGVDRMNIGSINKAKVNIYPNPIIETATVHIENSDGNLTFNLYELVGRLVLTLPNLTNGDVQLNNSGLTPGIYIYELRNANSIVSTGRVLIQ